MNHATAPLTDIERTLKAERHRRARCQCVSTTVREWCEGPDGRREAWQRRCECACHNHPSK